MTDFPIEAVRARFPTLARSHNGHDRVYLDNPGGTQVAEPVVRAITDFMIGDNANLGGAFVTSRESEKVVNGAHQAMADFFGTATPREVVIGPSMTTLTLHVSRSLLRDMNPGDEIIVTTMDHEGNVGPWLAAAADRGVTIHWARFDTDSWQVQPDAIADLMSERTRLVALNYASNLTGSINAVAEVAALCKSHNALLYVDAVQLAPHTAIDVQALGCDFLACSSYKFFGPHLGILWAREQLLEDLYAYKCRCSSNDLPEKWETGTPQLELLAGLEATVDYFAWLGAQMGSSTSRRQSLISAMRASKAHEDKLAMALISGLRAIPGIEIFGITEQNRLSERVPTVSFRHSHKRPREISSHLAELGIFVWDGHNYAWEIVRQLELPPDEGVVRIGLAHYNTLAEVDRCLEAVESSLNAR